MEEPPARPQEAPGLRRRGSASHDFDGLVTNSFRVMMRPSPTIKLLRPRPHVSLRPRRMKLSGLIHVCSVLLVCASASTVAKAADCSRFSLRHERLSPLPAGGAAIAILRPAERPARVMSVRRGNLASGHDARARSPARVRVGRTWVNARLEPAQVNRFVSGAAASREARPWVAPAGGATGARVERAR